MTRVAKPDRLGYAALYERTWDRTTLQIDQFWDSRTAPRSARRRIDCTKSPLRWATPSLQILLRGGLGGL